MTGMSAFQVMLHHGIGDFLMAVPALRTIKRQQRVVLDVIVNNEAIRDFGERAVGQDRIRWHTAGDSLLDWLVLGRRLRSHDPDTFLGIHPKGRAAGWFALMSGAPVRVGPIAEHGYNVGVLGEEAEFGGEALYDQKRHKVMIYLDFVKAGGVPIDSDVADVSLEAPQPARREVRRHFPYLESADVVGVAPGCGAKAKHKRWSQDNYHQVISSLADQYDNLQFVLIGAPRERGIGEQILGELPESVSQERVHNLMGETDLVELLAVTEQLKMLITVCNGPSHMAAAADVPIVGIYGPTNPGFTGPFSDKLHVVRKGYQCSPCYRPGFNKGCGNPRCMKDIEVEEVLSSCRDALEGREADPVPKMRNSMARSFQK